METEAKKTLLRQFSFLGVHTTLMSFSDCVFLLMFWCSKKLKTSAISHKLLLWEIRDERRESQRVVQNQAENRNLQCSKICHRIRFLFRFSWLKNLRITFLAVLVSDVCSMPHFQCLFCNTIFVEETVHKSYTIGSNWKRKKNIKSTIQFIWKKICSVQSL